ncbi:adenine phosphoribosyltransferase [Asbolus verrucosus]|uniref:Adenine phosphoribosyltransferase n=1 Tax=Asbolus verrucosus TaxID=1661398 RepID=A0A482VP69_ASBVE|nr:adenine phosphoribosyltransferase [Asbolus verrucosus]
MSSLQDKINLLKNHVNEYPDFPKTGILFRYYSTEVKCILRCNYRDLFSVFQEPEIARTLRDVLIEFAAKVTPPVECIVAVDARGFLLGPLIALELKVPFVPIRKRGKLPGKVCSVSYTLEYGEDTLEIQEGSVKKNQSVLIVDDLLATGGSLSTACKLVEKLGGKVAACLVVMELTQLKGRSQISADVVSLIQY